MIGSVEQFLSNNASPVGRTDEKDAQQSASETTEKSTNFLSLLLQFFGGFVHATPAAQHEGAGAEIPKESSSNSSSNVPPHGGHTVSIVSALRSGGEPDAAAPFGTHASTEHEAFAIVGRAVPVQPGSSTSEQSSPLPTTSSPTEKVITPGGDGGSASQRAVARSDDALKSVEKNSGQREARQQNISHPPSQDAGTARPETAMRNVEDKQATPFNVLQHVGGARTVEGQATRVGGDSPASFLIDWTSVKDSTQTLSSSAPLQNAETAAALKAVADTFADTKHYTERVNVSNVAASEKRVVMDFEEDGAFAVARTNQGGKEEITAHPSDARAEKLPPAVGETPQESMQPDRTAADEQQKSHPASMKGRSGELVEHRGGTPGETGTNLFVQVPSPRRSEVSSESTVARSAPPAAMKLPEEFAKNVVLKIVDEVRLHIAGKTSEVRVQLKPEHLGELSLRVTMQEGELAARLDVSVPAVKAALDAQLPQLREALAQQGIEIHRFDIVADSLMHRQAQQEQQRSRHQGSAKRQTDVDVAETYAAMRDLGYNTVEYII